MVKFIRFLEEERKKDLQNNKDIDTKNLAIIVNYDNAKSFWTFKDLKEHIEENDNEAIEEGNMKKEEKSIINNLEDLINALQKYYDGTGYCLSYVGEVDIYETIFGNHLYNIDIH